MNHPPFTTFRSDRLLLRRFAPSDLPTLIAYRHDPEVARFQSWSALDEEQARQFIAANAAGEPGVPGGGFQFAVELIATGAHIGDCYLRLLDYDPTQAEIGYTLARAYHGQGLGGEAVGALLDYCFGPLNLHRVIAITASENLGSIKLLERLGLRREGHNWQSIRGKTGWLDEFQYAILQTEWQSRTETGKQVDR